MTRPEARHLPARTGDRWSQILICLFLTSALLAGAAAAEPLSEELAPLAYRLGEWTAAVEILDAEGAVVRTLPSFRRVEPVFDGRALLERGRLIGTPTEVVSLLFVDEDSGRLTELGVSAPGQVDRLHPTFEEDRVVFLAEPRERGGETMIFRAVDSDFSPDRYETTGWISTDGGETWRQTFRQTNHRVEPF